MSTTFKPAKREIQLSKGYVATVSPEDFERLSRWRWHAVVKRSGVYAMRTQHKPRRSIYMHVEVHGDPAAERVDHIDHDTLNNRRDNLRSATQASNLANMKINPNRGVSRFKGVSQHINGRWRAQIGVANRQLWLGAHDSEEDAAQAYDAAARIHFGEFANLNFPGAL